MIITRATNVWIKFIAFVNDMWKKRIFEVFILQGNNGITICGSKL